MKRELKPCPFCGSDDIALYGSVAKFVMCKNCEAAVGVCEAESADETIQRWNRRADLQNDQ